MIQKVKGVVLHHLNYGDTSLIVHLYTDLYGRMSVMIKGARGQKKNRRISLYHPLALLNLEVNFKENRDLQQIREAQVLHPLQNMMIDPVKNIIALFLAEVFYKSIRETEPYPDLFAYLSNTIQLFDLLEEGVSHFHLHVLVHLTRFLGFRPQAPDEDGQFYFELETGQFSILRPLHENRLNPELTRQLIQLLQTPVDQLASMNIPRSDRNELIEKLLQYYRIHLLGMGEIKSYAILKAVFE